MFHPGGTSGGTATLLHVTVLAVRRNPEGGLSHSAMSRKTPGTNKPSGRSADLFSEIEASLGTNKRAQDQQTAVASSSYPKGSINPSSRAGPTQGERNPQYHTIATAPPSTFHPVISTKDEEPSEEDEYGSDFEAYSDDFDEEEEEPTEPPSAVVAASPGTPQPTITRPVRRRTHALDARSKKVLAVVKLVEESSDIYHVEPDARAIRRLNTTTTASQFNDDWIASAVQTDDIHSAEASSQCPEAGHASSNVDSIRLQKFIRAAARLCEAAILQGRSIGHLLMKEKSHALELSCPPLINGRDVVSIDCSPVQSQIVLVGYGPSEASRSMALLCVWDVEQPTRPSAVLSCFGTVRRCLLAVHAGSLVAIAGLEQGSLALWDLREPPTMHKLVKCPSPSEEVFLHRQATFTTDDFLDGNHASPVCCLSNLSSPAQRAGQSAVQVASMDVLGAVNVWTLLEISAPDDMDPGLAIGGRVKLVLSLLVRVASQSSLPSTIEFCRRDPNDYLLADGCACIIRGKRFGTPPDPSMYFPPGRTVDYPLSLSSSPFVDGLFLAGYASGMLCLFNMAVCEPVMSWPMASASGIVQVLWSPRSPTQFFALDRNGVLSIWDLMDPSAIRLAPSALTMAQAPMKCIQLPQATDHFCIPVPAEKDDTTVSIVYRVERGTVKVSALPLVPGPRANAPASDALQWLQSCTS
ncbi:hypothetical protein PBRA_008422 [Plasmodiophora brassicae]|uniref:WD repeat-containing protein 60 n=1 Tax=Plasmodiophora brassicae TaxID=37360 RepID=A0A0G4J0P6_PLABS|nr:hypothetical protein PBRA_008422 [Plasmodiophora brassicae]